MSEGSAAERIKERRRNAIDPEAFLLEIDAIEPTDEEEGLQFTPAFTDRVEEHLGKLQTDGVDPTDIGAIFGVADDNVSKADRSYPAYKTGSTVRSWPSEGAVQLDVAVEKSIREVSDEWDDVPSRQRYRILQSLRSFQEACLFCSGAISISDQTVESCCSNVEVVTVSCTDCERRFLEFTPDSVPGM
ncbi:hypothetical protein C483_02885 [Natrialba hulunbeirensis JCM 10989]|uniref:Uncharacterized protein n=1 Tax=Natrialba hulunbeirensis JCM 10989 TaxID=1227493 RepID=M0A9R5_9EURY|nr:hypothetical protein [Natrialba hulunbeirensis]ELY94642.1 hypothetical protein C483_02885 [Natrialba hulunbeirensis JCM 10989]